MPAPHRPDTQAEHRAHPRAALSRPAKVFHHNSARYFPAHTCNLSRGGTLLRLDSRRPFNPGDRIDILIAWSDRALLHHKDAIPATIARSARGPAGETFVAAAFNEPLAMPIAAAA